MGEECADIYALKEYVDMVKSLDERIKRLDIEILRLVSKDDVKRISKVPGVGKVSAPHNITSRLKHRNHLLNRHRRQTLKP